MYLSLFRADRRESFAIVAVSDAVMRQSRDAVTADLRYLSRLGLTPIAAFGVVAPDDARTHAATIQHRLGADVTCSVVEPAEAGEVARAGGIALVPVDAARTIDERFTALADMAAALNTRKVVFLGRRSGLQPSDAPIPSLVDAGAELAELVAALPDKQAALARQAKRLIDAVPHRMTVSVTSPIDLLRELFTTRGAGTLIRRATAIATHPGYDDVDRDRLRGAIESAFGRTLPGEFFDRPIASAYVAGDYVGAAIITNTPLGAYLSKFAVEQRARGEGVGRDLWRAIAADHPSLFWRSRPSNPITPWYTDQCDGLIRSDEWHVFWRGLSPESIAAAVAHATTASDDFS
jgi:acetylglutamate kinase